MVKLITGKKGSGKTKKMISLANELADTTSGHIVFIDDDKRNIYELKHDVRFMNMEDYPVCTADMFLGFLCGIISNDYDIETIFVDAFVSITNLGPERLDEYIEKLEDLSERYDVEFVLSFNADPDELSDKLQEMMV